MKFTILTAALVVAFASAQESGPAHSGFGGFPSGAPHPTGAFPSGGSGFAHPSGHHHPHHHPHHRPSGASGFAHPTGSHPSHHPKPSGFPSHAAPSGPAPTDAGLARRQENAMPPPSGSGLPEMPSDLPSGFPSDVPSGVAPTGFPGFPSGVAPGSHHHHPTGM